MNRRDAIHWLFACVVALACATTSSRVQAESSPTMAKTATKNPDQLWQWVSGQCATAARQNIYPPSPCIEVSAPQGPASGYAVFKDRSGRYQYLVLPLARITGIESEALLAPGAPNYFADAWEARRYVEAALHTSVPRDVLSMVVNSPFGRTQNQLHIHVDCVRADVHDTLRRLLPTITSQWQPLSEPLPAHGHRYAAMWVPGDSLTINPFQSLAASLPSGDRMAWHSLIVVGAQSSTGEPGFILLSGKVDPLAGDRGNGDNLQDLACDLVTQRAH